MPPGAKSQDCTNLLASQARIGRCDQPANHMLVMPEALGVKAYEAARDLTMPAGCACFSDVACQGKHGKLVNIFLYCRNCCRNCMIACRFRCRNCCDLCRYRDFDFERGENLHLQYNTQRNIQIYNSSYNGTYKGSYSTYYSSYNRIQVHHPRLHVGTV